MRTTRLFLPVLTAVSLIGAGACVRETGPAAATPREPVGVASAVAILRSLPEVFEVGGVLEGQAHATVSSRAMATVLAVEVTPGTRVEAGQILVRLDDRDLEARSREAEALETAAARALERAESELAAGEARATLARATFERISSLHDRRSATDQELDEATSGVREAEALASAAEAFVLQATAGVTAAAAAREAARATAAHALVAAPFSGTVTERFVDPGALATPGMALVLVEDTSRLELEVRVDESRSAWVDVGDETVVVLDTPEGEVERTGRVVEIARAVDADARAVRVTIRLTDVSSLRPGMFGRAMFPGPDRTSLVVPAGSVITHGQLTSLFVIEEGLARLRLVRVGRTQGDETEVLAGLSDGEVVVVDPAPDVRDGSPVRAKPTSGGQ